MKKILSFTLCLALIMCTFNFPTNSYALEATKNTESSTVSTSKYGTFSGLIISDESIDLSNVEVKIYSKELVYSEDGVEYYGGNYLYSILTNSDGSFSFSKPSEYCSYTVDLSTLPAEYGLTEFSVDIEPTDHSGNINLSKIMSIDTYLDELDVKAVFYDKECNELFVDYTVVSDNYKKTLTSERKALKSEFADYNTVKNTNNFSLTGTIVTSGKTYNYNEQFDATGFTPLQKIDFLYNIGEINEEEKYDLYATYLRDDAVNFDENIGSLSCEISRYYESTRSGNDYNFDNRPSYTNRIPYMVRDNLMVSIHYDSNFISSLNNLDVNNDNIGINDFDEVKFFNIICDSIDELLINLPFAKYPTTQTPASTTSIHSYDIYLTTGGTTDGLTFGEAIPEIDEAGNEMENSYMVIYYDFMIAIINSETNIYSIEKSETFLNKGVTHEFTHSILFKHGLFARLWAHEGFASAIEFISSKYTDINLQTIANSYISNPRLSITSLANSDDTRYGAMLLFLCVFEKFGGWDAMNAFLNNLYMINYEFYNAYTGNAVIFKAMTFIYNGVTYDYVDVFAKMAACNYDCNELYDCNWIEKPLPGVIDPEWASSASHEVNINITMSNYTLSPMSFDYFKFVNKTSLSYNVKCKIEVTDRLDVFTFAIVKESGNGVLSAAKTIYRNYDNLTINVTDLGGDNYKSLILIPINMHISGNAINYWVRSTTY